MSTYNSRAAVQSIMAIAESENSKPGRVTMPKVFLGVGIFDVIAMGVGIYFSLRFKEIIPAVIFSILALLGIFLIIGYFNQRIYYSADKFVSSNLWGVKRTYSYGDISGIMGYGRNTDVKIYIGDKKIAIDRMAVGKKEFIEFMMSADVLRFGDFTTKSGRKTPYFVNTGNYKTGLQNSRLGEFYAALVKETVGDQFDAMFGPAYKGIPLATSVSGALARNYGIDKPFFFNRKEAKDHGEGGNIVGYKPQDGDRVIIIEDVITAGTAIRETMPVLKGCADVKVTDMFISVNRCEVGQNPGKTAVMEVGEEFGIKVHALVTVQDIREYLADKEEYAHLLPLMDAYMKQYCVF